MKRHLRLSLCIAWASALAACSGMLTSDQPPEHVYWLEAVELRLGEPPVEALPDLLVAVSALPGLDTDRILVKEPGARLNHYAGARWPDHLPEVLTATLRLSLESSGRFDHVASGSRTRGDEWSLDLELREFFAVVPATASAPQVHVKLTGHLDCGSGDIAVTAAATAAAQEDRLSGIVAAFQSATESAVSSLGQQLAAHCFAPGAQAEVETRVE